MTARLGANTASSDDRDSQGRREPACRRQVRPGTVAGCALPGTVAGCARPSPRRRPASATVTSTATTTATMSETVIRSVIRPVNGHVIGPQPDEHDALQHAAGRRRAAAGDVREDPARLGEVVPQLVDHQRHEPGRDDQRSPQASAEDAPRVVAVPAPADEVRGPRPGQRQDDDDAEDVALHRHHRAEAARDPPPGPPGAPRHHRGPEGEGRGGRDQVGVPDERALVDAGGRDRGEQPGNRAGERSAEQAGQPPRPGDRRDPEQGDLTGHHHRVGGRDRRRRAPAGSSRRRRGGTSRCDVFGPSRGTSRRPPGRGAHACRGPGPRPSARGPRCPGRRGQRGQGQDREQEQELRGARPGAVRKPSRTGAGVAPSVIPRPPVRRPRPGRCGPWRCGCGTRRAGGRRAPGRRRGPGSGPG